MLSKRLLFLPIDQRDSIVNFADLYNVKPKIEDFVSDGLIFYDVFGRSVCVINGSIREGMVHLFAKPYADITVVCVDSMFIGWVRSDKIRNAGDRFIFNSKSLSSMPKDFNFAQSCAHMSEWGGWFNRDDNNWECFGCGQQIVLS